MVSAYGHARRQICSGRGCRRGESSRYRRKLRVTRIYLQHAPRYLYSLIMRVFISANAFHNFGGGDVIFSELGKRWSRLGAEVTISTNLKGKNFCLRRGISTKEIIVWSTSLFDAMGP